MGCRGLILTNYHWSVDKCVEFLIVLRDFIIYGCYLQVVSSYSILFIVFLLLILALNPLLLNHNTIPYIKTQGIFMFQIENYCK